MKCLQWDIGCWYVWATTTIAVEGLIHIGEHGEGIDLKPKSLSRSTNLCYRSSVQGPWAS
ncbi:hypothetical protein M413DRAFT_440796 [Hebeloma cylindrosporum]|uniref:Uncharacterized protein n=1 Tax=Hebeloma cylindrosporum TaxID=76867 RepID=A0A0C2YBY0_HEBCY|nr:hypothetical protein M413DRAFT_440796 [Hebeloma cylindrosporum h7]